jgi:hypothetical protein
MAEDIRDIRRMCVLFLVSGTDQNDYNYAVRDNR